MKNIIFFIAGFAILLLIGTGCRDKKSECHCRELEECIDGDCILKENAYYIGGVGIIGYNLYHGILKNNICVDTLLLDINTAANDDFNRFALFADVPPGVQNVSPGVLEKISDKEYVLFTSAPLCYVDNKGWYANMHCKIAKDSVSMKLYFWTLDAVGLPVDSCHLTLYK